MRTFIAVDFPGEILQKIDKITTYFKTQTPPRAFKWVDIENLHLTLKFIGELAEEKLPEVKSLIQETLKGFSAFEIVVGELGMFPNAGHPRVIWLGVQPVDPLVAIQQSLDQALAEMGINPEKRAFHPHLTIGRVRRHVDRDAVENIGKTLSEFKVGAIGSAQIQQIHLYQSKLTPQGPIYSPLLVVPLHQV